MRMPGQFAVTHADHVEALATARPTASALLLVERTLVPLARRIARQDDSLLGLVGGC
jgi:hypothetical protein